MDSDYKIHPSTIKAIDILLRFFTPEDMEVLKLESNGVIVNVAEQLVARWYSYVPTSANPLVFKANAMRILEANRPWIEFLKELKQSNIFQKLLDPSNYKRSERKITSFKGMDKRTSSLDTNSTVLTRGLDRNISGNAGMGESYSYSADWMKEDKEMLDAMKIIKDKATRVNETGEQDDSPIQEATNFIDQEERLDQLTLNVNKDRKTGVRFTDADGNKLVEAVDIFDTAINQGVSASSVDQVTNVDGFNQALKRHNFDTTREAIILADAINNIHNIEFIDVREKFFKKFDTLFVLKRSSCLS